jgi:hypothetical protein
LAALWLDTPQALFHWPDASRASIRAVEDDRPGDDDGTHDRFDPADPHRARK